MSIQMIPSVMTEDPEGSQLVGFARQTAERLVKDGLTRAQIRNIFTEVRRIEALWISNPEAAQRRLNMLKPKMDYQSARHAPVSYLSEVLGKAIDEVGKSDSLDAKNTRFQRFMDLFEAILAYHRVLGGRN